MASSAFTPLPMPAATGPQNLNYLSQPNIAQEFETSLRTFIQTVPPSELGLDMPWTESGKSIFPSVYATKVMTYLGAKPYMLKELVGTHKVMYSDLSKADKQWVRSKIVELFKIERVSLDHKSLSTRIAPETSYNWLEFRTVDCVFAAVIHELSEQSGSRIDKSKMSKSLPDTRKDENIRTAEATEEALEKWLAEYLKVPREVMQDIRLIYVMEHDLGLKNIPAISRYKDLSNPEYAGGRYVVSYEVTAGTAAQSAFWHTVHISTEKSRAVITDRQAAALGRVPGIRVDAPCDVWKIDRTCEQFKKLIEAFNART